MPPSVAQLVVPSAGDFFSAACRGSHHQRIVVEFCSPLIVILDASVFAGPKQGRDRALAGVFDEPQRLGMFVGVEGLGVAEPARLACRRLQRRQTPVDFCARVHTNRPRRRPEWFAAVGREEAAQGGTFRRWIWRSQSECHGVSGNMVAADCSAAAS